jgi:hypothetical protein
VAVDLLAGCLLALGPVSIRLIGTPATAHLQTQWGYSCSTSGCRAAIYYVGGCRGG